MPSGFIYSFSLLLEGELNHGGMWLAGVRVKGVCRVTLQRANWEGERGVGRSDRQGDSYATMLGEDEDRQVGR